MKPTPPKRGPINRFRKGFLGLLVLGACSTPTPSMPGVPERLPLGKDVSAALKTFRPTGEFNPTSYLTLGFTRQSDGVVVATPFVGTFYTFQDSTTGKEGPVYATVAALPNQHDWKDSPIIAGVGRMFLDEKLNVGAGVTATDRGKELMTSLAAKYDFKQGTKITWSTDVGKFRHDFDETFRSTSRANLEQRLPEVMGVSPTLNFEMGPKGMEQARLGTAFEFGRNALDYAYSKMNGGHTVQYHRSFGEKNEHFFFVGFGHSEGESTVFLGINLTGYGGKSPRRRRWEIKRVKVPMGGRGPKGATPRLRIRPPQRGQKVSGRTNPATRRGGPYQRRR